MVEWRTIVQRIAEKADKMLASSATQAEAYACHQAVTLAKGHTKQVMVWTDSIELIKRLAEPSQCNKDISNMILDIRNQCFSFDFMWCRKVTRLQVEVHNLAVTLK